jgi:hypothetical protein
MAETTTSTARIEPAFSHRERDAQPCSGTRREKARQKEKSSRTPDEPPEQSALDELEKHELDAMV